MGTLISDSDSSVGSYDPVAQLDEFVPGQGLDAQGLRLLTDLRLDDWPRWFREWLILNAFSTRLLRGIKYVICNEQNPPNTPPNCLK